MSNLVEHAKRELELLGGDPEFNAALIKAVEGFVSYGHSGGSASVGIGMLNQLLQFKNLAPLTDNPEEWVNVADDLWQSNRRSEAFSQDGGKTYYLLGDGSRNGDIKVLYPTEKRGVNGRKR